MDVTELGISMFSRVIQSSNALHPILVTEFPIITFLREEHPLNAPIPISVTESGM